MCKQILSIGALGGSGTRVVASLIQFMGYALGGQLNASMDDLIFAHLFKNPDWYIESNKNERLLRMQSFINYLTGVEMDVDHRDEMVKALMSASNYVNADYDYVSKVDFKNRNASIINWAWKEPNSHIYLDEILSYHNNIKYIHVIRHGVDMCFSRNFQQLMNWGWMFDLSSKPEEDIWALRKKQLGFWCKSTKKVLQRKEQYKDRIYMLNYNHLCTHPREELKNLISFINSDIKDDQLDEMCKMVDSSRAVPKFTKGDLVHFDKSELSFVESMGFQL